MKFGDIILNNKKKTAKYCDKCIKYLIIQHHLKTKFYIHNGFSGKVQIESLLHLLLKAISHLMLLFSEFIHCHVYSKLHIEQTIQIMLNPPFSNAYF